MIELTTYSLHGAPVAGPSAVFDELGGTIGRAPSNQLVLPDPDRSISRVHARVEFRGASGYVLVDCGSNPVSVNGQPLGQGREHTLVAGHEVLIGGFAIRVGDVSKIAASTPDPFADMFGDAMVGLAQAPCEPAAQRSVTQTWVPEHTPASPPPASLSGGIPDDWDPFADALPSASAKTPMPNPVGMDAGMALAAEPFGGSLDEMFDLASPSAGADPLGLQPVSAPTFSDRGGSELNTPMPRVAVTPPPGPLGLPQGAVLSWDARALPTPPAQVPVAVENAVEGALPTQVCETPSLPLRVQERATEQAAATRLSQSPDASADALLAALLQGLAVPGLKMETLTPATMRLLGELLHESTAGAVGLLLARSAFKKELRAEQTMIVARENNPLKFSPSAQAALQQLLGPVAPGFMAPVAAVRDAFEDLQAHQLAVMAGMKSALEGVLQRFDPAHLESQLASRATGLAGLIPGSRKARLWELFQELFGQLGREAQDNFDDLFGHAFVQAYEAQLERLADARQQAPTTPPTGNKG